MKLKSLALTAILATGVAIPAYAVEVGGTAGADAGVGADVGTGGASVGADVDADVSASTEESTNALSSTAQGTLSAAGGELAAMAEAGASVLSADGEVIGQLSGTRTDEADGSTQAVVDVDSSLDLPISKIAIEAKDLQADAEGALSYGLTLADLQSRISAQVEGQASAGTSN